MRDFLTAVALVFVIEGIMCAAFPSRLKESARLIIELTDALMRRVGLACAIGGVILVALVRYWF
jgi:uncharacterized protein